MRKRLFITLFFAAVIGLSISSCNGEEPNGQEGDGLPDTITVVVDGLPDTITVVEGVPDTITIIVEGVPDTIAVVE